jgi:hypothetical protein
MKLKSEQEITSLGSSGNYLPFFKKSGKNLPPPSLLERFIKQ